MMVKVSKGPKMIRYRDIKYYGLIGSVAIVLLFGVSKNGWLELTAKAEESSTTNQTEKIVSGILKKWDLKKQQGLIVTDLGEPVFFDIPQNTRMTTLSTGQQVTAKFTLQGQLITIIETPIPELKHP